MKVKNIFSWIFLLSSCAILSIGRIYDERLDIRLDIFDIKTSLILTLIYIISSTILIISIKNISYGKTKSTLFLLYAYILIITPILWTIYEYMEYGFHNITYEYMEYGLLKYINFIFIVIPISMIISEKFNYHDISRFFKVIFLLICFLSILGIVALFSGEELQFGGRLSVLGGGPIVFARWMSLGVLILIFFPQNRWKKTKYLLITLFLLLALAAGSRGPIFALFISLGVYSFLNFRSIFYKLSIFLAVFILITIFTPVGKKVMQSENVDRIVMNIQYGGNQKSTGARIDFTERSLKILTEYPFGVGCGNWQVQANKNSSKYMMAHAYPHNLLFEMINEYGFLAGLILLLLIWQVIYTCYSRMILYRNNKSSFYSLLFYSFIFLIINSMVSGDLGDARILFVIISMIIINHPLILKTDAK